MTETLKFALVPYHYGTMEVISVEPCKDPTWAKHGYLKITGRVIEGKTANRLGGHRQDVPMTPGEIVEAHRVSPRDYADGIAYYTYPV